MRLLDSPGAKKHVRELRSLLETLPMARLAGREPQRSSWLGRELEAEGASGSHFHAAGGE